jgi:hypothetical protein
MIKTMMNFKRFLLDDKEIYEKYQYQKTAKASDLKEYLWTKDVKFLENGKWVNGYEIIGKK